MPGDFSGISGTRRTLFGQTLDHPILLAPVAYHKLAHDDGELEVAMALTGCPTLEKISRNVIWRD